MALAVEPIFPVCDVFTNTIRMPFNALLLNVQLQLSGSYQSLVRKFEFILAGNFDTLRANKCQALFLLYFK